MQLEVTAELRLFSCRRPGGGGRGGREMGCGERGGVGERCKNSAGTKNFSYLPALTVHTVKDAPKPKCL